MDARAQSARNQDIARGAIMVKKHEDLKAEVESNREIGLRSHTSKWDTMARNVLRDDLGEFEDSIKFEYDLDVKTRDRLIAHTRQDAAMAYYAARAAYLEAVNARILSWITLILCLIILYKVW